MKVPGFTDGTKVGHTHISDPKSLCSMLGLRSGPVTVLNVFKSEGTSLAGPGHLALSPHSLELTGSVTANGSQSRGLQYGPGMVLTGQDPQCPLQCGTKSWSGIEEIYVGDLALAKLSL